MLLDAVERTAVIVVQVYPDGLIRCEYVRLLEGNLKSRQRNFAQSKLRTARVPGRNAELNQAQPCLAQDREGPVADGPARRSDQTDREAVFGDPFVAPCEIRCRTVTQCRQQHQRWRRPSQRLLGRSTHDLQPVRWRGPGGPAIRALPGGAGARYLQQCLEPKADRPAACEAKRSSMHSAPGAVQPGRARPAGIGCTTGPQAGG